MIAYIALGQVDKRTESQMTVLDFECNFTSLTTFTVAIVFAGMYIMWFGDVCLCIGLFWV